MQYVKGDATAPVGTGNKIIVHVCNDMGGWGKGFVMALSDRWKAPEVAYRDWYRKRQGFKLGAVQLVQVADDLWVANLIGQHKTQSTSSVPPIRYGAIEDGLMQVAVLAQERSASIHMPRIGCGLAGGTWDRIEPILLKTLSGLDVLVYDR